MSAVQDAKRRIAVGVMDILVARTAKVHYKQFRPMATKDLDSIPRLLALLNSVEGIRTDCSETVTLILHLSGFKDPNGQGFSGIGNTVMMRDYLKHFSSAQDANPCSIVVLNADMAITEQHVCVCRTADHVSGDPLLFSHGSEADPVFVNFKRIKPGFPGHAQWLSVAEL